MRGALPRTRVFRQAVRPHARHHAYLAWLANDGQQTGRIVLPTLSALPCTNPSLCRNRGTRTLWSNVGCDQGTQGYSGALLVLDRVPAGGADLVKRRPRLGVSVPALLQQSARAGRPPPHQLRPQPRGDGSRDHSLLRLHAIPKGRCVCACVCVCVCACVCVHARERASIARV